MIKGTITSINISKEKGVIKTPVDSAVCKAIMALSVMPMPATGTVRSASGPGKY